MKVRIHRAVQQSSPTMSVTAGSPAPGLAASPFPAIAPAAASTMLECGLPKVPGANIYDQTHWTLCRAPVVNEEAGCDLPMLPTLNASDDKKAYCVLTEGSEGNPPKRLTEPAWYMLSNV